MADVFFEVSADFSQAVKEINGFSKQAASSAKNIESSFSAVGTAITAAFAGIAIGGVTKVFKEIVSAGLEAEKSQKKLTAALRLTGEASAENVRAFKEYADALSVQIGVDDDAIISQVAFLKSLGATNEQAKTVIATAADLSAAFGQDLSTSVEQLSKTYQGSAGTLARLIPGINNLTKAQLASGAAVELVRKQFEGLSGQNVQGVAGALNVLSISFNNFLKQAGAVALGSSAIKDAILLLSGVFQSLTNTLQTVSFNDLITGIARVGSAFAILTIAFRSQAILTALQSIAGVGASILGALIPGLRAAAVGFGLLTTSISAATIALTIFKAGATLGLTLLIDALIRARSETASFSLAIQSIASQAKAVFLIAAQAVVGFVSSSAAALSGLPVVGDTFKAVAETAKEIGAGLGVRIAQANTEAGSLRQTTEDTAASAQVLDRAIASTGKGAAGLGRNLAEARSEIQSAIKTLSGELQKASSTASEQLAFEFKERITLINKAAKLNVISGKQASELRGQAERAAILASSKLQEQEDKDRLEKLNRRIQVLSTNPIQLAFDKIKAPDLSPFIQDIAGGITGALSIASQGAAGAGKLFSNIAGAAANAIIPGLGQAVGPIVDLLAQGPEKVKETFTAFFENLPTVLENIILAIPALLESLADAIGPLIASLIEKIPQAIEALFARLPEIAVALIEGMTRAAFAFAFQMPFVAARLALSLTLEMPKVAISFINQLIKEAPRFVTELIKSIPSAIGGGIGGIGGAVGGVFGGIGDIFGFADGGRIPDVPSLRGDRGLTRVDAGEQIFSRDLTSQLEQFLAGQAQGSSQPMQVNLTIGTEQLASALFQVNRQGWRTA